jgi:hypothetical protein
MDHFARSKVAHLAGSHDFASDDHNTDHSHTARFDIEAQTSPDLHVQPEDEAKKQRRGSIEPKSIQRADTTMSRASINSIRRRGRANTAISVYENGAMGRTSGWTPGQEPGIDTSDPAPPYSHGSSVGPDSSHPDKLNQLCEITVVDYVSFPYDVQRIISRVLGEIEVLPTLLYYCS